MTDDQLNALFAEKVAGWVPYEAPATGGRLLLAYKWLDGSGLPHMHVAPFTQSADAVLPWLEKQDWAAGNTPYGSAYGVFVEILHPEQAFEAKAESFPKAAVIALLRAHGVEVD